MLSLEERSRLTPEAYGYLLGARGAGLDRRGAVRMGPRAGLASSDRRVGLDEIQDLVLEAALGGGTGDDRSDFPGVH